MHLAIKLAVFFAVCFCPSKLFYVTARGNESFSFICTSAPDEETIEEEEAVSPEKEISTRSFLLNKNHYWSRGLVPYELSDGFTPYEQNMLMGIMKYFNSLSCVRWEPRRSQRDYVLIQREQKKGVCNSAVGRVGGRQTLRLSALCFNLTAGYQGAIEHEMMHTLGFIHEHQRLDRDCYVMVARAAVEGLPYDYKITQDTDIEFPYDFGSIMHYGRKKKSLEGLNGEKLGNIEGKLTELDEMKLKSMYCNGLTYCDLRPHDCRRLQEAQEKCHLTR